MSSILGWTGGQEARSGASFVRDADVLSVFSAGLQSPIIAIEPHSAAVRVGETATFRCRVYSGAQPVRLEWKAATNQHLPGHKHTPVCRLARAAP